MQKPEARLENWALVSTYGSPYQAHEALGMRLTGNVYGHDDFNNSITDGEFVYTSRVVSADFHSRVAETLNTLYRLGTPDPKWVEFLQLTGTDMAKYGLGADALAAEVMAETGNSEKDAPSN